MNAQNKVSGIVSDENNHPLSGATVYISDLNKGTHTNLDGSYELSNLPDGKLKIQYLFVGYANVIQTIVLKAQNQTLNVILKPSVIEAEEIVVSGGYNSTQHENAVKIDVLNIDPQLLKSTPNFVEMLTRVPGVDMISKGSGVSKPVIRGLSMNDILVLNNGVRVENYQYSDHHPLGIDEFGVENVEIIKGPASLLYGSDAIGGVINFVKEKPAPVGTIAGDYNLQLFSNTLGMTNNFGMKGSTGKFFGGFRAGQKTNADYRQGGGSLVPNSRFNEWSAKANLGFSGKKGTFKMFYDYYDQKLGLVEDEAIEAITERGRKNNIFYQRLNTHLVSTQNTLYLGKFKFDINAAYQSTGLIHFGEENVYEIQMRLNTLTYEAKLHLPSSEKSEYIIGFQGMNQQNANQHDRETKLLPNASTNNYSAFGMLQHTFFKKLQLQTGLRYDYKTIDTKAIGEATDTLGYRPAIRKSYGSFSGSAGLTYHISESLLIRANFAAAYRTPNLAELTSNGPHELRYEIGDNRLVPENSYESDLSLHYHYKFLSIDISGFYNRVNHYIFISPTGDTAVTGIEIFKYKQANAALFGGEAGLHIHPPFVKWLHFESTFSAVIGKQLSGEYLPFVPAHKLSFELRAEKERMGFLHDAYISVRSTTAFKQNRNAPDETPTAGYTLLDASIGSTFFIKKQPLCMGISVNNLLDTKYTDHLSTLKEVSMYNPGINVAFNLNIPFGLVSKE
jgi:iron complex outermembrane receptor protein